MQLPQVFNSQGIDPASALLQLPVGQHPVVVVGGVIESTKGNVNSGLVKLTLEIIDGPMKGMQGYYRINLYNVSQQAAEIAQRQMSALCHVTGVPSVGNLQDLYNRPFQVVVAAQEDPKYTEIKGVKYIDGSDPKPGQYGPANGGQMQQQQQGQQQGGFGGQPAQNQGGFGQQQQQQQGNAWGAPPQQGAPANGGNNGGQGWQQQGNPQGQAGKPAWGA